MATLSKSSTDQQVWDEYDDNCTYEEDSSATKAAKFISAVMMLLRRQPIRVSATGHNVEFNISAYQKELGHARSWLDSNKSSGESVRHLSVARMRD